MSFQLHVHNALSLHYDLHRHGITHLQEEAKSATLGQNIYVTYVSYNLYQSSARVIDLYR